MNTTELRKQEEQKFHNEMRGKFEQENTAQSKKFTSNKKFYSITRKSNQFVKNFIIKYGANKKILDYCCGSGKQTLFFAGLGVKEAVGIDISDVSINLAKEEAKKIGLENKATFFVMDAEKTEFPDNSFDLIVCSGVLHHLDINRAYKELARILKSDGKIICDEPLIYNPIFQLYRKMTPKLRTAWELEHILSKKEINNTKKYFNHTETKFFHLATLLAVPFRKLPGFNFILSILEKIDFVLLKLPFLKWWAWQIIFILSKPKKTS